eukprot:Gb_03625 [translate_table: standard]
MGLKEKIGKEAEAHERLSSELQQSNDVAVETRWKHGKSLKDLQGREAEINRLIQEKEIISIELSRMESNNNELKERVAGQNNTMQELTKRKAGPTARMNKLKDLLKYGGPDDNSVCSVEIRGWKQILTDLLNLELNVNSMDGGKMIMRERLGSKHALIMLDDVDDKKQLKALHGDQWFGGGSRFIITITSSILRKRMKYMKQRN